jgi:thioredoxin-like negative regulator of GroEL
MKYLDDHNEFEQLIGRQEVPAGTVIPKFTIIYFTATWCGPCRRLDLDSIVASIPEANWLKCEITRNDYTPGYCNVRSIPSFMAIVDGKIIDTINSNNSESVISWAKEIRDASAELKNLTD